MDPVLVTGSVGLVGARVAERLAADGVDVLGVDRRPSGGRFRSAVGDVTDRVAMQRLLEGRPNVVHAGAVSGPMLMQDDPFGVATVNLGGAAAMFEAARAAGVRRLVWLSSIAVYGNQATLDPVSETAPMHPRSFYGHTKCAGEFLLRGYAAGYGLPAVALRLSTVYGPERQTEFGLRDLVLAGLAGTPIEVAADLSCYRQYIHVDDAAEAVRLALAAARPASFAYNVTGGTWETDAALARMLADYLPGLAVRPGPPAWHEGHIGPLSLERAAQELGFHPRVTLRDGLRELVEHYRAER